MAQSDPAGYAATTEFLFAQKAHGPKFGIDRMRVLAAALDHPERAVPCIHIAGTNGKGSVAAMVEAILRAAGWRTGLYTSPHLVEVGERVQVDRVPLTPDEIVAYTAELRPIAERIAAARPDERPSFFEYMTAMAFLQFARRRCDIAVIEVGLGGRLDATNIVHPQATAITSIGLDHCELLGNTLEQIAAEKAGILKKSVPVVVGRMPSAAQAVIRATAARVGTPVIAVENAYGAHGAAWPRTNLAGEYQGWNAATATLVARALLPRWRINDEVIARGLAHVAWPGRWQEVKVGERTVFLDASHNPEGAEVLGANLARLRSETGCAPVVVVGVLGANRAGPLLAAIARQAAEIHLVVPDDPRACRMEELAPLIPATFRGRVVQDRVETIFPGRGRCAAGAPAQPVVVTGSILLIGEVMRRLGVSAVAPA